MDFKHYAQNKKNCNTECENCNTDDLKKTFDETVKRSKNMSESQMMDEIMKQAAKERQNGNLSDEDIEKFYKTVAPMLDKKQIEKLKKIMNMLK